MTRYFCSQIAGLLLGLSVAAHAAEPATVTSTQPTTTDPSYHLCPGDTVTVTIFNEPELSSSQTIGRAGDVRLPLIDEIKLAGKSVREAEHFIEDLYQKRQYLRTPVVSLVVTSYFPREVSVLGAVRAPGMVAFPRDVTSIDVVEAIARVGGFLPIAKSDSVAITHKGADGKETVTLINLEDTITGRRQAGSDRANLAVYPGDRIWVPERLF
jgi:polysaccharide export outer membrane protein